MRTSLDKIDTSSPLTLHDYEYLKGNRVYWATPGAALNNVYEFCKNRGYGSFGAPTSHGKGAMTEYERRNGVDFSQVAGEPVEPSVYDWHTDADSLNDGG